VLRSATDPDTGEQIAPFGFDNLGFSVGLQQDLDGDGDLDVGSNDPTVAANHYAVRYANGQEYAPAGTPGGALIGSGSFTVTGGSATAATLINFFGRNAQTGSLYMEDGNVLLRPSFDSPAANGILLTSVPEHLSPSVVAMIGLLSRRRRR
jgi:hypothetical protein